jgi:hypothetical protein
MGAGGGLADAWRTLDRQDRCDVRHVRRDAHLFAAIRPPVDANLRQSTQM